MILLIIIILGDYWENLSVPNAQQDWWKSSQPARCTYNLQPDILGSFPANVRPDITGHFGCGLRAKFSPSVGQLGGGRFLTNNSSNNTILDTKSSQTTWIVYFQGNLSFQGHQFFQISQEGKRLLKRFKLKPKWRKSPKGTPLSIFWRRQWKSTIR